MALPELFKVTKTRYVDANGKRCKRTAPGAIKQTETLGDWYVDIKPTESAAERIARRKAGQPSPKRRRVKLCHDKRAAQEMLRKIVEQGDKQAAGIIDFHAYVNQPLGPMVDAFERHLIAIGRTAEYIETTLARIQNVFDACNFLRLVDIDCAKAEQWLYEKRTVEQSTKRMNVKGTAKTYKQIADRFNVSINTVTYWRKKGAPIIPRSTNDLAAIAKWHAEFTRPATIGTTTSDHYVTALKRFGNWLVKPGRKADANPFGDLDKLNDDTEVRKQRRVLPADQFARLVAAASGSPRTFRGLANIDRAMIYTLAAYSGLRASEIGSLRPNSFDFGESPTVTVEAAYTKNSELAVIPLRSDLADRLESYLQQRERPTLSIERKPEPVWPGTWTDDGAEMIRMDLAAAGIPYTDDTGKYYDFHSLRHQFITGLALAGVSLRAAQQLARHSKPELTANIYTHLSVRDTAADVEKLTAIPTGEHPEEARATGTHGTGESLGQQWGQQELKNRGISGDKRPAGVFSYSMKKAHEMLSFASFLEGG